MYNTVLQRLVRISLNQKRGEEWIRLKQVLGGKWTSLSKEAATLNWSGLGYSEDNAE